MDKIWDRKSFEVEVIGRCGGDEKTMTRTDKSPNAKIFKSISYNYF